MTPQTLLYRQVNPDWIKDEVVTSQVFKPTKKDEGKLSTYDGDLFTAEKSYEHFTSNGRNSIGVLGVTNGECVNEELTCERDNHEFEGHVSIDFNQFTKNAIERKAKILRELAVDRGWLHKKPVETV